MENFPLLISTFLYRQKKENCLLEHGGPKCDDEEITITSKSNELK